MKTIKLQSSGCVDYVAIKSKRGDWSGRVVNEINIDRAKIKKNPKHFFKKLNR